jgi:DNA modification methylase
MPMIPLTPYWQTSDKATVRLFHGDVIDVLRRLPSTSVQCVVTSPPYWG